LFVVGGRSVGRYVEAVQQQVEKSRCWTKQNTLQSVSRQLETVRQDVCDCWQSVSQFTSSLSPSRRL